MLQQVSVQSFVSSYSRFIQHSRDTGGAGGSGGVEEVHKQSACVVSGTKFPITCVPPNAINPPWSGWGTLRRDQLQQGGLAWLFPAGPAAHGALPSPPRSPVGKEPLWVKNHRETLQIHPVPVQPKDKSVIILCNYSQPQRRCFMRALISCSAPTEGNNVIFKQFDSAAV